MSLLLQKTALVNFPIGTTVYILVEKIDKLLVIPKTRRALYNVSQIFCFANGWGHALVRCQDLLQKLFSWVIHGIHELPCDKGRTTCKNGVIFGSSQDRRRQTLEVWHIPSYFQGFFWNYAWIQNLFFQMIHWLQ